MDVIIYHLAGTEEPASGRRRGLGLRLGLRLALRLGRAGARRRRPEAMDRELAVRWDS